MLRRSLLVAAAVSLLAAASAHATDPVYFQVPSGDTVGSGITAAANGDIWFASGQFGKGQGFLGRLRPSSATAGTTNGVDIFPTPIAPAPLGGNTPCCASAVTSVGYSARHDSVWFVQNDGELGTANPALVSPGTTAGITAIRLNGNQGLQDLAVDDQDDGAWITENGSSNTSPYYGNRIAFVGNGLAVNEYDNLAMQAQGATSLDPLRYSAQPYGITIDADNRPWFTEADSGNPGYRIATAAPGGPNGHGAYSEYLVTPCIAMNPCSGTYTDSQSLTDIAVAQDGTKWFTNNLLNEVDAFNGTTFTHYSLSALDAGLANGQPRKITVAPDGSLWIAEFGYISHPTANAIIKIVPGASGAAPTATVWHLGAGHAPYAVAPDNNGNIWFTVTPDSGASLIGELAGVTGAGTQPPATSTPTPTTPITTATPPVIPTPNPQPKALVATSIGTAHIDPPQVKGSDVSTDQICVGRDPDGTCRLVYIISAGEYVTAFPGTHQRAATAAKAKAKPKSKAVTYASKSVTTKVGTKKKVTITLNAAGRKLLKRKHKLVVYFTAQQVDAKGKRKLVKKVKLTLKG